jgi:3-(3-hydroxy-phenyl)propionate hydroxylase
MNDQSVDVAVVGYGPTGQAVASLLARRGHRVCAFDKAPALYGQPRLITLDGEVARVVQAAADIDLALRESAETTRYLTVNKKGDVLVDIDWSDGGKRHLSGYPRRIEMYQPYVEEAMDLAARERGVEVAQGWQAVGLEQDEDGVRLTARNRDDGAERTVAARYVVGADGARSFVRETLGIEREDFGFKDAWLSVDCLRKRDLPARFDMPIVTVDPGRTHAALRIGQKRLRFEFLVNPDDDNEHLLVPEVGYDFLREAYELTPDDVEIYRQVIYPFEGKLAYEWRRGRALLAGDAAHLMPPFLGQGASSGLRDAVNLAWKLDLVLRGVCGDALLDTYGAERRPHVRVHVAGSCELGRVACERDPEKAAARDAAFMSGEPPPAPSDPILETGVLRRDAAGAVRPPAGELGLQGTVRLDGVTGRLDDVLGWGFHLIGLDRDPAAHLGDRQRDFLVDIGGRAFAIATDSDLPGAFDVDGAYAGFFAGLSAGALLVRPDFTIFGAVADVADAPLLLHELHEQLEGPAGTPSEQGADR